MKAACYINIRDGIITIWADPGGMDYFQGFTCKEEDLQETNTTHRSLELEASLRGAKDSPTYENACVELKKEVDHLEGFVKAEREKSRDKISELHDEIDALRACLKFVRSTVSTVLDGDVCEEQDKLTFSEGSIDDLYLSGRVANCLNNIGIRNLGQLAFMSGEDLLKYRGFGPKALEEVKEKIADLIPDAAVCEEGINVLGFSPRVVRCLRNNGVESLEQLVAKSDEDLLKYRNFGKGSLREIKHKLAAKKAAPHLTFD